MIVLPYRPLLKAPLLTSRTVREHRANESVLLETMLQCRWRRGQRMNEIFALWRGFGGDWGLEGGGQ